MKQVSIKEDGQAVDVEIGGELNEVCAEEIFDVLRSWLKRVREPQITFHLDGLLRSTLLGRAKLIELQELIKKHGGRTAWISHRPRFRGMALVVCHSAEDPGAKVASSVEEAREWLSGDKPRIGEARERVDRSIALVRARWKQES